MARGKLVWTMTGGMPAGPERGVRQLTAANLAVFFQPIVAIATGYAVAYEALARPKSPEYPNPVALFEAASSENACGRLGRLIREIAFGTCGDVPLFVNLHPQELSSRWLVQTDDPIGFHTKPVYLEVTEAAALTHFDLCRDVLAELCRRSGAALVVDDFGAGYSNLERVVDLAPSVIKLDLALTRNIHQQKARQIVVRHVVNMCKELGAEVVAEGVESVDELKCVRDLGVDYAQGYLLARPAAPPPPHVWPLESRDGAVSGPRAHGPLPSPRAPPPPPKGEKNGSIGKSPSAAPKRASKPPSVAPRRPSSRVTKPAAKA